MLFGRLVKLLECIKLKRELKCICKRKRLVELVGREGYGIEVSTFHAFAVSVKSRYPEYFHRDPTAVPVSDLHAREIIDAFLKGLPYGSPLSGVHDDLAAGIGDVMGFISKMKRNGISPLQYRKQS